MQDASGPRKGLRATCEFEPMPPVADVTFGPGADSVVLDISDASAHRHWSRHSFTSSVLAGLLVLLLTVLIVDRVTRMRQLRNQPRAIAVQAGLIVAQTKRAAEALTRSSSTEDARGEASDELRTYTQMLLTRRRLRVTR